MSIVFDVLHELELIVTYIPGTENVERLFEAVARFGEDPRLATYNTVIVVNDASNLPPDLASIFANLVNSIEEVWGDEGDYKTAIVVSRSLDYGISRVLTTFRGRDPKHMMVFRNLGLALNWLEVEEESQPEVASMLEQLGVSPELATIQT